MSPEEEVIRAGEADQFLNSRLFQDAKAHIEASLANQRRTVPIKDTEMHTRLIIAEQVWAKLLAFFQETSETGKLARIQLTNDSALKARAKQMFGPIRG